MKPSETERAKERRVKRIRIRLRVTAQITLAFETPIPAERTQEAIEAAVAEAASAIGDAAVALADCVENTTTTGIPRMLILGRRRLGALAEKIAATRGRKDRAFTGTDSDELWPLCETLVAEAAARALRKALEGHDEEPKR